MTSWLMDEGLEEVRGPVAQGDDEWEQDAWENDDTPEWAEDEDWDDDEDEDDEGYDDDDGSDDDS